MKSKPITTKALRLFAAIAAVGTACIAEAITTFNVSLDTSSLIGDPLGAGPYYLDFQLIDGGTPGNNSATISDFMFGGGSATSDIGTFGEASGDLSSSVQLSDTYFWNEFYQSFIPGSWVSFVVELTNNANGLGDSPDLFSFTILDSALGFPANIPTESFSYSLLEVNIDGSPLAIDTYAGIDDGFGSDYSSIGVPSVSTSAVPEGSTYGICFMSMLALFAAKRRFGIRDSVCSA